MEGHKAGGNDTRKEERRQIRVTGRRAESNKEGKNTRR